MTKSLYSLILTFTITFTIIGQVQPEHIYPMTQVKKDYNYYLEQAELWKKEVEKNKTNKDAWFYYFYAARYANMHSSESDPLYNLQEISKAVTADIPGTFEDYFIQFLTTWNYEFVLKANELSEKRFELHKDLITWHMINGEPKKAFDYVHKWYDSNEWSPGLLKWNYNVLASLDPNAILITWGDNDTYPVWLLQNVKQFREDVSVICAPLLFQPGYLSSVFPGFNIATFGKTPQEYGSPTDFLIGAVDHIQRSDTRPLYLGIASNPDVRNYYEDKLYMIGLALKYSDISFDNIAVIKNNYENKFMKDYLKENLENDMSESIVKQMNVNYIPSMMLLYKHYKASGEQLKEKRLKEIIDNIANESGDMLSEIKLFTDENDKQ